MESYKCKLCFKSFFNGRALGGHMRSHMPSLLHKFSFEEEDDEERTIQLEEETESDVSSSSSEDEKREKNQTSSLLLEDDESETNITKRSKRTRKLDSFSTKKKIMKTSQLGYRNESDPAPSASDTEEDLAFCLMMLSRDKWKKKKTTSKEEEFEIEESEDYKKQSKIVKTKGRFKCETCDKVFKSYQALGGHRASHKKNRVFNKTEQRSETEYDDDNAVAEKRRNHECPICLKVFASGQALGGHKRSHGIGNHHHQVLRTEYVMKQRMIDLNLPAPNEEDEVSVVFQ